MAHHNSDTTLNITGELGMLLTTKVGTKLQTKITSTFSFWNVTENPIINSA